jgi:hypothetical protein
VTPEEGRICLEWKEPDSTRSAAARRSRRLLCVPAPLEEEDYGKPLNNISIVGASYVDARLPTASSSTRRATLAEKPKVDGPPAVEAGVDYRDVFPPAAPARLDALSEGLLVRLVWDPVAAADLAGYAVFRAEGSAPFARLTPDLIKESFFNDSTAQPGHRYRYVVRAVDTAGNQSPPSPEATAEPF